MAMNFLRSIWPGNDKPLGGHYQIVEQLGAGGFGQTFKAQDLHLPGHPFCVVKQLKPQVNSPEDLEIAHRLFETEAQTLYRLGGHPQIPRLLAHFSDGRDFYLVQELVEGHSLSSELMRSNPWDAEIVVALLGDILGTLAFVHENRVIHRDLKPSNLMRRHHDNRMVLIDFGAVKEASTQVASFKTSVEHHTVSIGTQGYMPNEQLAGQPYFSSDVYAIGIIGIQALTGQHPRLLTANPRTGEIDWQHHAPDTPPELIEILNNMVKYDFRTRYRTAGEAFDAFQSLPDALSQAIPAQHPFHPFGKEQLDRPGSYTAPSSASPPVPKTQPDAKKSLPFTHPEKQSVSQPIETGQQPTVQAAPDFNNKKPASAKEAAPAIERPIQRPRVPQAALRSSSPTPRIAHKSVAPRRLPQTSRSPAPFMMSIVAIAAALGLITFTWRAFTSDTNRVPSSALSAGDDSTPDTNSTADGSDSTDDTSPDSSDNAALSQLLQQAESLRDDSQYEQSIKTYDEAIALDSESSDAYAGRCYSLNRLERYDEAIAACDQALTLDSNNVDALLNKGYTLDQREQFNDAITLYDRALELKPDFAEAWSNRGTSLLRLGKTQDALTAFDQAIELNSGLSEAWNNRGVALWDLQQFEAALASVERALELQPEYEDAQALQTEMRRRLGR